MDLLSLMSSFKCCKNFPVKRNFSERNFLEVYAAVHYKWLLGYFQNYEQSEMGNSKRSLAGVIRNTKVLILSFFHSHTLIHTYDAITQNCSYSLKHLA